ncbi:nicotinamide-nucleotide adenylyltransferase 2 [Pseudovirgaria hyperparasitica]|uniref:Nicotinamide-nucleotide adenylyltransferase n=1 Tax=Pseudovirgaria hyperparasitica TaxID=470096 RepID=A0A6A6WBX2_9PEZI|nr:nicotinamide-nucleotide adenylyltransferase 2 [Pseudovirgaria hyperparasitica]KAF2760193.1 nicotinamide-nucleotide adenylyltransferase 2 [Pseudovirgaria hyperparasitica]
MTDPEPYFSHDHIQAPRMIQTDDEFQMAQSLDDYEFPSYRLSKVLKDSTKTPLVLVACGSFSPPTYLHLRMAEQAADYCRFQTEFEVIGGFLSPVGDAYKKQGLASARHRINMCNLAVQYSSNWIAIDPWEPLHKEYLPTAQVLDHFEESLNRDGGMETSTGERKRVKVALLAGADLIQTMSSPGVWAERDLDRILGHYGAFILERAGTDIDDALASLQRWRDNIRVIPQLIQNDVSSTKIRLFRKRDMSIRYLVPDRVVDYIYEHNLYISDDEAKTKSDNPDKGKGKAEGVSAESS